LADNTAQGPFWKGHDVNFFDIVTITHSEKV